MDSIVIEDKRENTEIEEGRRKEMKIDGLYLTPFFK